MVDGVFKDIEKLEAELWQAADHLRANSKLTSSDYFMPVLGIIFLRHAANRHETAAREIAADQAAGRMANLSAIVGLYRGEKGRFLALVAGYLGQVRGECGAIGPKLDAFEATLDELRSPIESAAEVLAGAEEIEESAKSPAVEGAASGGLAARPRSRGQAGRRARSAQVGRPVRDRSRRLEPDARPPRGRRPGRGRRGF